MGNGGRCLVRYPILWKLPAGFVLAWGILEMMWGMVFHWHDSTPFPLYLNWSGEWPSIPGTALFSLPDTAEILATNLNCLLAPFPLSILCALLLLGNFRGLTKELGRTFYRRFGVWSIPLSLLLLLCLLAELTKPLTLLLLLLPRLLPSALSSLLTGLQILHTIPPHYFITGVTVVNALSLAFEYLVGTCLHLYLLLLAYGWVRGLQFESEKLLHFAVRRLGFVLKWTLVIIGSAIVLTLLPLLIEAWLVADPEKWNMSDLVRLLGRPLLALGMLSMATVQIRLALHNDTLRGAMAGHLDFLRQHGLPCFLFLLAALASFLVLKTIESIGEICLGESMAGEVWKILLQTGIAALGGWILAAWVCFYTSLQRGSRNVSF